MSITLVQSKSTTAGATISSPLSATFNSAVTIGNTIIVAFSHNYINCSPNGCTDNLGNVYTRYGSGQSAGGTSMFLWFYSAPVTVAGTCTPTITYACGSSRSAFWTEWSGISLTSPFDGSIDAANVTSPCSSGSLTTTTAGDLLLSFFNGVALPVWTGGSGQTVIGTNGMNDMCQFSIAGAAGSYSASASASGIGGVYKGFAYLGAWKAASSGTANNKSVSDSYSIAELLLRSTSKRPSDSISLVSSLLRQPAKILSSPITLADAATKATAKAPLPESIATSESIVKNPAKVASDSFSLNETFSRVASLIRSFADSFSLSDFLSSAKAKLLAFSESLALFELVTTSTARARSYIDSISPVETLSTAASRIRAFVESISVFEALSSKKGKLLALLDDLTLSETLSRSINKVHQDALAITDGIRKATQRVVNEVLSIADVITSVRGKIATFVESLAISDLITRLTGRSLTDQLSPSETIKRSISRSLADAISLIDAVRAALSGANEAVRKFFAEVLQRLWPLNKQIRTWSLYAVERTWNASENNMIHTIKDPAASEDFEIDWSAELGADTIASSVWSAPSGITLTNQTNTSTTATARVGGGTLGRIYKVANTVTTASGQVKVQHISMTIATI